MIYLMIPKRTLWISLIFYLWNIGLLLVNAQNVSDSSLLFILDWVSIGAYWIYTGFILNTIRKRYISNGNNESGEQSQ